MTGTGFAAAVCPAHHLGPPPGPLLRAGPSPALAGDLPSGPAPRPMWPAPLGALLAGVPEPRRVRPPAPPCGAAPGESPAGAAGSAPGGLRAGAGLVPGAPPPRRLCPTALSLPRTGPLALPRAGSPAPRAPAGPPDPRHLRRTRRPSVRHLPGSSRLPTKRRLRSRRKAPAPPRSEGQPPSACHLAGACCDRPAHRGPRGLTPRTLPGAPRGRAALRGPARALQRRRGTPAGPPAGGCSRAAPSPLPRRPAGSPSPALSRAGPTASGRGRHLSLGSRCSRGRPTPGRSSRLDSGPPRGGQQRRFSSARSAQGATTPQSPLAQTPPPLPRPRPLAPPLGPKVPPRGEAPSLSSPGGEEPVRGLFSLAGPELADGGTGVAWPRGPLHGAWGGRGCRGRKAGTAHARTRTRARERGEAAKPQRPGERCPSGPSDLDRGLRAAPRGPAGVVSYAACDRGRVAGRRERAPCPLREESARPGGAVPGVRRRAFPRRTGRSLAGRRLGLGGTDKKIASSSCFLAAAVWKPFQL